MQTARRSLHQAVRQVIQAEVHPTATRGSAPTNQRGPAADDFVDNGKEYFVIGLSDVDDGSTWTLG